MFLSYGSFCGRPIMPRVPEPPLIVHVRVDDSRGESDCWLAETRRQDRSIGREVMITWTSLVASFPWAV